MVDQLTTQETTLDDVTPYESPVQPAFALPNPNAITPPGTVPDPSQPPPATLPAPYVPDESKLASGQLTNLLDKNSSYIQQAERAGERKAQSRGLLNSSMGVTAGRSAAIAAAAPIAVANADAYQEAGLTDAKGKIASNLAYEQSQQTDYLNTRNNQLQGLISSGLSQQEAEQKMILDQQQQAGANFRQNIERQIKLDEFAVNDREAVSVAMTNYGIQFQKDIASIQADETLSAAAKTDMMQVAQQVYESTLNNTAALYDVTLSWETPF